jgi:hypothetical protein
MFVSAYPRRYTGLLDPLAESLDHDQGTGKGPSRAGRFDFGSYRIRLPRDTARTEREERVNSRIAPCNTRLVLRKQMTRTRHSREGKRSASTSRCGYTRDLTVNSKTSLFLSMGCGHDFPNCFHY